MVCASCGEFNSNLLDFVCSSCLDDIVPLSGDRQSLYLYSGSLRNLILESKARGNEKALLALLHLFLDHPLVQEKAAQVSHVMPAPSSLWGRLRGKIDVSYWLAYELSRAQSLKLLNPPLKLGWHLQKRAQQPDRGLTRKVGLKDAQDAQLLVVDDVLTTGATLDRLLIEIKGFSVSFLTLAARSIKCP